MQQMRTAQSLLGIGACCQSASPADVSWALLGLLTCFCSLSEITLVVLDVNFNIILNSLHDRHTLLKPALRRQISVSSRSAWFTEFQDSQGYTEKPHLKKLRVCVCVCVCVCVTWLWIFRVSNIFSYISLIVALNSDHVRTCLIDFFFSPF